MTLKEQKLINRLVKQSLNEENNNSLLQARKLLIDAYNNIDKTIKGNDELEFNLSSSLMGIKNAIRIIGGNLFN